jgi:hypothetical protein
MVFPIEDKAFILFSIVSTTSALAVSAYHTSDMQRLYSSRETYLPCLDDLEGARMTLLRTSRSSSLFPVVTRSFPPLVLLTLLMVCPAETFLILDRKLLVGVWQFYPLVLPCVVLYSRHIITNNCTFNELSQ